MKFVWKKVEIDGIIYIIILWKLVVLGVYSIIDSSEIYSDLVDLMVYNVGIVRYYYKLNEKLKLFVKVLR